jgi:F-type H+-transporting ATPase subunit a
MPTISIKAEPLFEIAGFVITNCFVTSLLAIALTFFLARYYHHQATLEKKSNLFYILHFVVKTVYDLFQPIMGEKTEAVFPLLGAFFFYILFQNWFGLLPGVGSLLLKIHHHHKEIFVPILRSNNADLNTTLALALISVSSIQYYGVKFLGFKTYIKKYVNFSSPIACFLGVLEAVSELSKVLSFAFRLFGNIFAGEVLLTIIAFLIPVLASFPFLMLEIFVGMIQALIFSMLTAVFMSIAVSGHH